MKIRTRSPIVSSVANLTTQNNCPKKYSELKCKAHPNSISHADLACFYHRRAQGLHVLPRPRPDGSKDSTRGTKSPVAANFPLAEDDDDVDLTEVFTSDNESHEVNTAHQDGETESVDTTEYFSDGCEGDKTGVP